MIGGLKDDSTVAAVWRWLTAEETESGLVAADVLAVRWWLEERWFRVVCQLVKMAVVCQSVGNSSQPEHFQRSLKIMICCVDFLHLAVAEATSLFSM